MNGLHVHGVSHAYGGTQILDNISVTVPAGELVCLLGPSGCGKTTLLRIAAGLERLQQGSVFIGDKVVAEPGLHVPPEDRKIGLMFQDYALFPHLSVLDNVMFGLTGRDSEASRARAHEMLGQVGMLEHAESYPHTLSGGQQQRVALARALAPAPELLLLDEPFSGLDTALRAQIREETLSVLKQSGVATMMVTHDAEEAMFMADRIKILGKRGRVLQIGRPAEIYYGPANEFIAGMFGPLNRFDGVVLDGAVRTPFGQVPADGLSDGCPVEVLIRPEGLLLDPKGEGDAPVEVLSTHLLGRNSKVHLRVTEGEASGQEFDVCVSADFDLASVRQLSARIDPRHAFVYPKGQKGG